jgi:hypothetical protein
MVPLDRWIEAKYFFCVNEIEGCSRNWSEENSCVVIQ